MQWLSVCDGGDNTWLCPLGSNEGSWPKPLNPIILVTCFTASACWGKQNRMSGWKRNKPRIFLEFILLCHFLRGTFVEVIVSAPLARLMPYHLHGSSAAFLAHSDRPVLCLMTKVQAVLSGYSVHLYPTSVLKMFDHVHMSAWQDNCSQDGN